MKDVYSTVVRPLLTEKATEVHESSNTYVFEVAAGTNKIEVKKAIEMMFGVQVSGVRTLVQRGKAKRFGRYSGKRSNWKKAYVTLAAGEELDLFAAS
jgi:large subunit ribosomal protein L23